LKTISGESCVELPKPTLLSWPFVALIRLYQMTLSHLIGRQCRFHPTCSHYALEAILKKGVIVGLLKATWRVLRCNPLCRGGHDPVDPDPALNAVEEDADRPPLLQPPS